MPRNASVRLTDDIVTAWKASGATLADLIRRGLSAGESTTPAAPVSTTTRADEALLAAIEQRLTAIERAITTPARPSGDEYEAQREQHTRERAYTWQRRLHEAYEGKPFTTADAAATLGCISSTTAGGYLRMMAALGIARRVDDRGSSHQWQVKRPTRAADEA